MKYRWFVAAVALTAVARSQALTGAVNQVLPMKNGRPVVAMVNGDAISLDELTMQLGPAADKARLRTGIGGAKELELLERLTTIKLIVQEADTMGLDEIPEIRKQVDVMSREILREVLMERLVRHVKPDPAAVERIFRDMVREWKTTALIFQDDATAKGARKAITGGATFTDISAKALATKAAKTESDGLYHPKKDYLPQIAAALAALKVGEISPVLRLPAGFAIVKVVDIRYPPNAEARAQARQEVLAKQQTEFLKAHEKAMRRKYVVINEALFKGLDYTAAKPGLEALLTDKRIVAEIKGGASITVGNLTDYLRMQVFHRDSAARQGREMNEKKAAGLEATLSRRLLNMEAVMLGIDKTHAYRDRINGYRESLIFDSFVEKVIAPENKMTEEEVKRQYSSHPEEYSYPEMIKARSLGFSQRGAAEAAVRKLREGADYGWVTANAEGQLPKDTKDMMIFDGRPVLTGSMPDGVQKALKGAKTGEYRLYQSPEGHFYVIAIQQAVSSTAKPYTEVREEIAKKLYGQKIQKGVEEYAAKLRTKSKVETYLKRAR